MFDHGIFSTKTPIYFTANLTGGTKPCESHCTYNGAALQPYNGNSQKCICKVGIKYYKTQLNAECPYNCPSIENTASRQQPYKC